MEHTRRSQNSSPPRRSGLYFRVVMEHLRDDAGESKTLNVFRSLIYSTALFAFFVGFGFWMQ